MLREEHSYVATKMNNLAWCYGRQGRYDSAETLYLKALQLYKRVLGEDHPHVATSLNNLANLYRRQGRYEDSEPLYLEALAIAERVLGAEQPQTQKIRANYQYGQKR